MILVINVCKEKLHYYEFVRPIEDILKNNKINFFTRHYKNIKKGDWGNAKKIIICGTSLKDNDFLNDINYFTFLRNPAFSKPVLGICAGMQIMSIQFDLQRQVKEQGIKNNFSHIIKKKTEIGYYFENFKRNFLSLEGKHEVYHLHNNYLTLPKNFENFTGGKIPQAIKHKTKSIYGVLFHPEVRNKKMVEEFSKS